MNSPWARRFAFLNAAIFRFFSDHPVRMLLRRKHNFRGRYDATFRKSGSSTLLVIAAGYKPGLFRSTLSRVRKFAPKEWDVCVCCAGLDSADIRRICEENGWSYLTTRSNKISLPQNIAIANHPEAEIIIKMDEDIFLAEGTLPGLVLALEQAESLGMHRPGIISPLLNVNGYSSRIFLEKLGRLQEFESRFGPCIQACVETPVWQNAEAARFLWEATLPFESTARSLAESAPAFSACPHRFSIGCFVLRREFWQTMEGFTVPPKGVLGIEEVDIGVYCHVHSRPILIAHHLLAGHAGFGHQMKVMEPWIAAQAELQPITS